MSLAALNLNHLVALDALLRERNVGRAATRMGVTQSAMSHTLRSLRELMNDPLLVRVGNGMVLTPYAEEARERLQRGLSDLEAVVSGRAAFDPSRMTDTFTLATHDPVAAGLVAPLLKELHGRAPLARLRIQPIDDDALLDQLANARVDVALTRPNASLQGLATDSRDPDGSLQAAGNPFATISVISRRGHPKIKKKLTLATFCKLPHAALSVTGEGPSPLDHMLAEQGRTREVVVRAPFVTTIAEVVAASDMVAIFPTGVCDWLCEHWPLQQHPFPIKATGADLPMVWHPRFEADPRNMFFRDVLRTAIQTVHDRAVARRRSIRSAGA